jgi:dihydromethanopterin reductase (acceptor)
LVTYLAWGITGAGQFLSETVAMMHRIKKHEVKITTFLSSAAEEVVRMYGLQTEITKISRGGYYEEILRSSRERASSPTAGRLQLRKYSMFVISPCTANTVAKIAHGIADTLITNATAQAQKGGIPIIILPTDFASGGSESCLPHVVKREICTSCRKCVSACEYSAISMADGKARIALLRCTACGDCVQDCPVGAITFMQRIHTRSRKIDFQNVQRLKKTKGIYVCRSPDTLERELMRLIEDAGKNS